MTYEDPFVGTLELALVLGAYGIRSKRKARIDFSYTPNWTFVDPRTGALRQSGPQTSLSLHLKLSKPQRRMLGLESHVERFECPDLMAILWTSPRLKDALTYAINIDALLQEGHRRRALGIPFEDEIAVI